MDILTQILNMNAGGAYGGGKAGGAFDPLTFAMKPQVVIRALCWLFSIVVFGCISSEGWRTDENGKEVCLYNGDGMACKYGNTVGVFGFLASMAFIVGEYLFERMSSVKSRKRYVMADMGFSAFWAFMYFIAFIYLWSQWSSAPMPPGGVGASNMEAAIFFSFISIFVWIKGAALHISHKATYGKTYVNGPVPESYALYYYNYNKKLITSHNVKADRYPNKITYRLDINQFTDMRLIHFKALFPKTTLPATAPSATAPPQVQEPSPSFNFITDLSLTITAEDQGTVCNSGWAYATAKAVEIREAIETGITTKLSAQNLIDCAGSGSGCTKQVAQTAFEYLVGYQRPLYSEASYPNTPLLSTQGMCLSPPTDATATSVTLASYSRIDNPTDDTIKSYVSAEYPVVIEYDPTSFDFMHYKSGIFQQPDTYGGSHYMVVVGYGTDTTENLDYWLVLNSFGTTWGENGFIRIKRETDKPLTRVALFPTAFSP